MSVTQKTEKQIPGDPDTNATGSWVRDTEYEDIMIAQAYVGRVSSPPI